MQPAVTVKLLVLLAVVKHSYHNMELNHFFKFVFLLSCCTSVNTICKCNSVSRFVSTSVRNEWHSGTRCTEHTELHSNSPFQTRCVLNHRGFCCFFFMRVGWGVAMDASISGLNSQASTSSGKVISDTLHCSFSHIRAPDSCALRTFIFCVLWRKVWATSKTTGHK